MSQTMYHIAIFFLIMLQCGGQEMGLQNLQKLVPTDLMAVAENKDFSRNSTKVLAQQWESYYNCQKQEYLRMVRSRSTVNIIALSAFEGSHVNMTCKVCLSPVQHSSDISWHVKINEEMQPLNITGTELHFDNLVLEQHGEYLCKFVDLVRAIYLLHVLHELTEPIQQVRLFEEPRVRNETRIDTGLGEVRLYSEWGAWSNCSEAHRCGHVGRRERHGLCMLAFLEIEKLNEDQKPLAQFFPHGLPCRSPLIPTSIQLMKEVQGRPSEVILGFCKVRCRKNSDEVYKVWDSKGKLIDKVDNSAGVYSSLQNIPKLLPPVTRVYLFPYTGERLTVKCPGYKESDSPVQWHKGRKPTTRREISLLTKDRVTINVLGNVVFKELHMKDTNIYSCWQEGRLVGTVKVRVMSLDVAMSKLHWSLFMAGAVLTILLLAIHRIYKHDTK